jgi:hypothetical protein
VALVTIISCGIIIIRFVAMLARLAKRTAFPLLKPACFSFSKIDKKPNLYDLLQLKPDASRAQIEHNYYKLCKKYNPTNSPDPEDYSRLLNEAYVILSNEPLRTKYDREQGFVKDPNAKPEQAADPTAQREQATQQEYKKMKVGLSEALGDKATRTQSTILTIAGLATLIATVLMIFGSSEDSKKKRPSQP